MELSFSFVLPLLKNLLVILLDVKELHFHIKLASDKGNKLFTYIFKIRLFLFQPPLKIYDRTFKDNILGVLTFTVFILSWIPINIACLFKKDVKWKEIKHDKKLNDIDNKI